MQIGEITRKLGTLSIINFGRKHAEKASQHADPGVKAQADRVRPAVSDLETAYAARRPLQALWSAAAVAKDAADDALDDAISSLSYELLAPGKLNRDRSAPAYRVLFPSGNLDFINGPDRAQIAHVQAMVSYLEAHPDHPMAGHAPDLAGKVEALAQRLEELSEAEARFRVAQSLEAEKREALGRALRKSVRFLRDFFDGDEKKVDQLFPTLAEAKVDEEPDAPATPG